MQETKDVSTDFLSAEARAKLQEKITELTGQLSVPATAAKFSNVYNERGLLHLELGNSHAALSDFTTAAGLCPENAHAHNNRGYALLTLNRTAEAAEACSRAIEMDGTISEQNLNMARKHAELVARGQQLTRIVNGDPKALSTLFHERGLIRLATEGALAAKEDLQKAIDLDAGNAHASNDMAFACTACGDLEAAERHHLEAVRKDPSICSDNLAAIQSLRRNSNDS